MAAIMTQRGKPQSHLPPRDFSSPTPKRWPKQRLLQCEVDVGQRRSAPQSPAQDSRLPLPLIGDRVIGDDGDSLKELREKLLGHLREAANKMKVEMSPISPAAPASERAGKPKLEPRRSAADSQNDKRWNLRSRTNARRTSTAPLALPAKASERTMRLRSEHSEKEKKKQRFSISLSREEIEEDIFAFTGSRPRRRPKKRPRNVQWQLDVGLRSPSMIPLFFIPLPLLSLALLFSFYFPQALFPGFSLSEITPELYKVAE
ncbi:hypothetical protein MA16_Dca002222 [Dendrobium catenatum]|uniref:Uncharacterized protein n=1 Tax=Dendrobium catenatum TaxID=906689 RepID=A0A2I0VZW5_9ASPA|nr:hypothetical protein MA16_Dca002222 [Dendrobium catenatum]